MAQIQSELLVDLDVCLHVNGRNIRARGKSRGIPGGRNISAVLDTDHDEDAGFNLGILAYVLLTGQPSMSFVREGAINPFRETGGVYKAVRTLQLNKSCGSLRTVYSVEKCPTGLMASFEIEGQLKLPDLSAIDSTVETWVPDGPGSLLGHFTMCWHAEDGSRIKGEAETHYQIPTTSALKSTQFREILIDFRADRKHLEQQERIVLFSDDLLKTWTFPGRPDGCVKPAMLKSG